MIRALWFVLLVACGSSSAQPAAPVKPSTRDLLASMASLAGVVPEASYLADWTKRIDAGESIDGYIDGLLGTERFAGEVMPSLLFGAFVNVRNYYAVPSGFVLQHADTGPWYLRQPCAEDAGVAVHPWWDLSSEIKVCPDAYRPDKWTLTPDEQSYKTPMVLACDSQVGSPELETKPVCGCGPNLIRCLRDEEQYNELNKSLMDEVKRTTAYVVAHDLPITTLFTGNATYRDRNVELYYRRQKIGSLQIKKVEAELSDLAAWPEDGKWAPRSEVQAGQHAGVLTAPQILHSLPDRRQRQRGYYEILWCNLKNAFGATTHKVLELNAQGNNTFVSGSWEKLAHTELCMTCHARLDYGFQFFLGYPDSRASTYFVPSLAATGQGPLYGKDIRDHRGDAPLTPAGFAKLATEQPDFKDCMTSHVADYVLGDRATADDVEAIENALDAGTFKPPMKIALERYALRWRAEAAAGAVAPAPRAEPPPPATAGTVAITGPLRARLDHDCGDCHDQAKYSDSPDADDVPFDLRGAALPRPLVVNMLDRVAFGMMPKNAPLDPAPREALVHMLIDTLWTDPATRTEVERYYLGRARGLPAHQIDNALYTIDQIARAHPDTSWGALERGIWTEQSTITPGFLAITGLEALRACAQSTKAHGGKLDDCVARATSLDALSRWPLAAHLAPPHSASP